MEINTKKRGACKNLKGLNQNDSKDAKSRFSTFQLQMTFSHRYIFHDGSSSWLLKNMPRMHETTTESVLTNLRATYSFYCSFWVRTIDYSIENCASDVSILRQELCTARHQFKIFYSSDFAIQRHSDAFRTALWNMSALCVRNLHSEFGP